MPSKFEKLKEELKNRNSERGTSPLEEWFIKCFNQLGVYNYQREYQIETSFLDFAWPEIKFAVEADGDLFHFDRKEKDLERDKKLTSLGWKIYRVNSKDAWNYKLFTKHLIYIYQKTQSDKIPPYAAIELLSNNNPDEYIKHWHKTISEFKENYLSENRIYHCNKCDNFYSRDKHCSCG